MSNITRNSSRSDILILLTLLSTDVLLRVPSLTKVEVRNFALPHFPKWTTCYVSAMREKVGHIQMPMFLSLRYSTMVSFILSTTFSVTEIHPRRDSAKCQLLRLYSQFSFKKKLKLLQFLIFIAFWRNVPRLS